MPTPPAFDLRTLPGRTRVRLTGSDCAKFLHNFCTADVKKLTPGQTVEAFVTNVKARALFHIWITCDDDALLVETWPGQAEPLVAHLDRYLITEDVEIIDETEDVPEDPSTEATRIAAGLPRCGVDFGEGNLAPEIGRPDAISYTKGCYLGQEPIARLDALGHVNKEVVAVEIDADVPPPRETELTADGKTAGKLTSSAAVGGRVYGIATVRAKFLTPETSLTAAGAAVTVRRG
ncbi:MAG: hypothetical protein AAF532_15020 [Planctomycetota bacterium]